MQSKFVGDKLDFCKYGLLRRICGLTDPETEKADLKLGVVWYLVPDACCGRDGGHIGYLEHQDFRDLDSILWDDLKGLVERGERCVHKIPGTLIMPVGTTFYDCLLHFPPFLLRATRREHRNLWLAGAKQATKEADVVYLDPDTGIAPDEAGMLRKKGPKFAYTSDIREFWEREQSVIVFQHRNHQPIDRQVLDKLGQLERKFPEVEPIVVKAASCLFFILPQPSHRERIEDRVQRINDGPWGRNGHLTQWVPQQQEGE